MLGAAREILSITSGFDTEKLAGDRLVALAVVRLFEVLGEAANRVTPGMRTSLPNVPWSSVIALRNRLIHGYDAVDLAVLWEIIENDLPFLVAQLEGAGVGREA